MGVPVVTVGNRHICPEYDGKSPHVGGVVTKGVNDVFVDGIPIAVEGSECVCTGSGKKNAIKKGCDGVFVDGQRVAVLGSMTDHGGIVINGNAGVSINGSFYQQQGDKEKPEPRIFNLQWRNEKSITKVGEFEEVIFLTADTVGYEEGEEVDINISDYQKNEIVDKVTGIVRNNRIEAEWSNQK